MWLLGHTAWVIHSAVLFDGKNTFENLPRSSILEFPTGSSVMKGDSRFYE